jgi:hypothetical protein
MILLTQPAVFLIPDDRNHVVLSHHIPNRIVIRCISGKKMTQSCNGIMIENDAHNK